MLSNIYAADLLWRLPRKLLFYDFNDSPFQFAGVPAWAKAYWMRTLPHVDEFFVVSEYYRRQLAAQTDRPIVVIGNGVEFDHFSSARLSSRTSRGCRGPGSGTSGCSRTSSTSRALEALRQARRGAADPDRPRQPGHGRGAIRALGTPEGWPSWDRGPTPTCRPTCRPWTSAMIPFRAHDPFVEGINPNKVYQYLAAGAPVVTTPVLDLEPDLRLHSSHGTRTSLAGRGRCPRCPARPSALRERARAHDWGGLAARMVDEIERRLAADDLSPASRPDPISRRPMAERSGCQADPPRAAGAHACRPHGRRRCWRCWSSLFFHEVVVGGKTLRLAGRDGARRVRAHGRALAEPATTSTRCGIRTSSSACRRSRAATYNPLIYPPDWPVGDRCRASCRCPELTWMLIYYLLAGRSRRSCWRANGVRARRARCSARSRSCSRPTWSPSARTGTAASSWTRPTCPLHAVARDALDARAGELAILGGAGARRRVPDAARPRADLLLHVARDRALHRWCDLAASTRQPGAIGRDARARLGVLGAALLAFGIAGVYNLPLRDYARYSIRGCAASGGGVGMDYATQWSLRALRAADRRGARLGRLRRLDLLGRHAVHRLPERVRRHRRASCSSCPAFLTGGATRGVRAGARDLSLFVAFGKNCPLYGLLLRSPAAVQQVPHPGDDRGAAPGRGGARRWRGAGRR